MDSIQLLDKQTIDKIAAGEVVDRPASIVKELVENAIDAGATSVSVEIRDGGRTLIRITDNGSGIPADEIKIAFLRHSTSKIRTAQDLSFIHSFGFRGEALSSIAAVSRTELCTKTRQSLTGVIYRIEGGEEISVTGAGLPDGTTVIVRDLFYNTPARLKFLKSAQTEAGYVQDTVQRIALSHPEIAFKYTANGTLKLRTPGNGNLKDTIYAVFGRDIAGNLLPVQDESELLSVEGFIGKPEIARGNRNFEYYFVNGRFIRDRIIQKALEDAYTGYQMKGTFPFAVFHIAMEPELVDVNVHPSKLEVRFFNAEAVYQALHTALRRCITQRESIPAAVLDKEPQNKPSFLQESRKIYIPEPFEKKTDSLPVYREESFRKTEMAVEEEPAYHTAGTFVQADPSGQTEPAAEEKPEEKQQSFFISEETRKRHHIVGTVFDTYWIVEMDDKMYIIDQHAAHEKVLYEKFLRNLKEGVHYSQQIMPPVILTLSAHEEAVYQNYQKELSDIGFEIEHFGGSEYRIRAVPTDFYSIDSSALLLSILGDLNELSSERAPQILHDTVATAACKAAVKGGNRLSLRESEALIDELLLLDNPYHCPHGRPTIISMSRYELDKKFKRIL